MVRHAFAACLALLVVACGGSEESTSQTAASAPSTAPAAPSGPSPEEIAAAVAALPAPYNTGDYEAGRKVFAQCRSCHLLEEGAGNRVGPNLHGLFGRQVGALEDFSYSPAVQAADFVWAPEQLEQWLDKPRDFLPGTRMIFNGVHDETQRRDLIAYLMVATQ